MKIEIEFLISNFQTECNGGDSCCTPENQCGVGQGDCDKNADCNPSLDVERTIVLVVVLMLQMIVACLQVCKSAS